VCLTVVRVVVQVKIDSVAIQLTTVMTVPVLKVLLIRALYMLLWRIEFDP
jgi:hypothetical protein